VKLYADEAAHEPIRAVDVLVVSCVARVEVPAALWRKRRMGELAQEDAAVLIASFELDYAGTTDTAARFVVVGLPPALLDEAARLVATHRLRAFDAVQLASALAARRADASCDSFACSDAALRTAAAAEGFHLLPDAPPSRTGAGSRRARGARPG
jgi:hypothetical protein